MNTLIKKYSFLTVIAVFTLTLNLDAQSTSSNQPSIVISSVNVDFGINSSYALVTNDDYQKLRNSAIDKNGFIINLNEYNLESYSGVGASFAPSISIGLTPFSKTKGAYNYNQELRIRLGGSFGGRRSFFYTQEVRSPYDTLTSSIGKPDLYIDSIYYHNPSYVETIYELNIGLTYLYKTDASKRWHFYTGFGAEYGYAFQNYVTILDQEGVYYAEQGQEGNKPDYNDYFDQGNSSKSKISSSSHFVRLFIPLGVNFRISNKNEFWRHLNLYTQINPGLEFQMIPGVENYTNPYAGIALLGVRYTIN